MDGYRFGYHADLLAQFPTIVAGAAFASSIDNQSDERATEVLIRAQEQTVNAQLAKGTAAVSD